MSLLDHHPAPRAGRRMRRALLWGGAALVGTGLGWLALHTWWPQATPFGPQPHPAAAWLLRAHGVLAWALTALGGAVWQGHVRPAWRLEKRRWGHHRRLHGGVLRGATGAFSAGAMVVMLATAAGLQYAPDEAHAALSWLHWILGLVLAGAALVHWRSRHRRAA